MTSNEKKIIAALTILAAFLIALAFSTVERADAAQPYGGCAEAGQAPRSEGARHCRHLGWEVRSGFVVSPRKVLRFYDLDTCIREDGSAQRRACGVNVEDPDTFDGTGKVYLAVTLPGAEDDRIVYLNQCRAGVCSEWVR